MVYSNNSDGQDLVSMLNDLTGMDNVVYSLQAKTRDMNRANRAIWTWIHEAYGGWQYDDKNNTSDFPTAKANLVANQVDYSIPTEANTVIGVEILNQGGVWERLQQLTVEQIQDRQAEAEFNKTPAQPRWYRPMGNSIKIYPASNYSQDASIRVMYDRETNSFTPADTTKSPGFDSMFHEAVAIGGAAYFSSYKSIPQMAALQGQWLDYEKRIKEHYSSRYKQLFPNRMTVRDAVQEYM
jgi:hypothetical protein